MDWSNEHYVRIYTRDTTTWLRLGWDGQNALMQLARKADLAGVLDIDDLEPWEALVMHCRAPEDAAKRGLEALLRHGVVEHVGTALLFPNYIEAQEASKSDKQRQKELRDRRRAFARRQAVTDSSHNEPGSNGTITKQSGIVTNRDGPITDGHALSLDAVQYVTDARSRVRETESPLRQQLANCWDGVGGATTSPTMLARLAACEGLIASLARERGSDDPVAWFGSVVERFRSDQNVQRRKLGLAVLLSDLRQWAGPVESESARPELEEWVDDGWDPSNPRGHA